MYGLSISDVDYRSHQSQQSAVSQLQQQLADPVGSYASMYSMVPRCDICGFTDGVNQSSVIEHIRTVHCAERDDHIRAQDLLIKQQSDKIESAATGTGGKVGSTQRNKPHPLSNRSKKPFHCSQCDKGFAQKIHLETHLKNVHLKDKPFKCGTCNYSCANKGMLDKHIRIVHNKERPFKCQVCGSSFGQKVHMDAHINAVHIQNRPFKCDACVYCATTKGLLDKHYRTVHQKVKPFACDICQSRFGQKAHLSKHIVTVHKKEKPYKCEDCDYQGSTKTNLNKHVALVHHKEKPYSCNLCPGAKFGQKAHLDNHTRQVHGGNVVMPSNASIVTVALTDSLQAPTSEQTLGNYVVVSSAAAAAASPLPVAAPAPIFLSDVAARPVTTSSLTQPDPTELQHKCIHCSESFSTSNNLRIHVVTVHETNPTAGHFLADPLFQLG